MATNHKIKVYTTKTLVAYKMETQYLGVIYAYVANAVNPPCPPQDPTSCPQRIYDNLCRIASTEEQDLSEEDQKVFLDHIETLRKVIMRLTTVDEVTRRNIQIFLSKATYKDLRPLLLSAEIEESRLKPGDVKSAVEFAGNWERIVADLRPDEITILKDECN